MEKDMNQSWETKEIGSLCRVEDLGEGLSPVLGLAQLLLIAAI